MAKYKIMVISSLLLSACVSLQNLQPTPEEVAMVQATKPDVTLEALQSGCQLYIQKCANCHRVYYPANYTATEWQHLLPKMFKKAKISSDIEKKLLQQYILSKREIVKK
jgi:hypothetical protein